MIAKFAEIGAAVHREPVPHGGANQADRRTGHHARAQTCVRTIGKALQKRGFHRQFPITIDLVFTRGQ